MLLSTVIQLTALDNGSLPMDLGAAIRAQFLRWVGEADLQKAEEAHDGDDLRPYTVSGLNGTFRAEHGFRSVRAGQSAWFRLTTLDARYSEALLRATGGLAGETLTLSRVPFRVREVADVETGHEWARRTSCESLADRFFGAAVDPAEEIALQFASPTMFKSRGMFVPLPAPDHLLESWLNRWNAHSTAGLPMEGRDWKEARFALTQLDLKSRAVRLYASPWFGCVGQCRFRVLSRESFWLRLVNLLAEFAFFCGTGAKTSFGMGQTRVIHHDLERADFRPG